MDPTQSRIDNRKEDEEAAAVLPSECWVTVVSFLSFHDCLCFGSTSMSALKDIQSDLMRRCQRMTQTYYYSSLRDPRVFSSWKFVRAPVANMDDGEDPVYCLPTVQERVACLRASLPPSSRFCDPVAELANAIDDSTSFDEDNDQTPPTDVKPSFSCLIEQHQKHTKSHKLHASILKEAIYSIPPIYASAGAGNATTNNNLTVTAQDYVGDALCAYYLMGHVGSGIVEGGPTEQVWIDGILDELRMPRGGVSIHAEAAMYRLWVFLLSTLLRIAPFSLNQQFRLGLATPQTPYAASPPSFHDSDALGEADGDENSVGQTLMHPHYPFCGLDKKKTFNRLLGMEPFASLKVKFHTFGRLGPTFRGRDMIRSQVTNATTCIGKIFMFHCMPLHYLADREYVSNHLRSWVDPENWSCNWIYTLFEEAKKTRPMTVEPPLVIIRMRKTSGESDP